MYFVGTTGKCNINIHELFPICTTYTIDNLCSINMRWLARPWVASCQGMQLVTLEMSELHRRPMEKSWAFTSVIDHRKWMRIRHECFSIVMTWLNNFKNIQYTVFTHIRQRIWVHMSAWPPQGDGSTVSAGLLQWGPAWSHPSWRNQAQWYSLLHRNAAYPAWT